MSTPDFNMEEWFESATTPDAVTVEKFDKHVDEYLTERLKAEEIEAQLTEQNKKVMKMQAKIMEYLDLLGKKKHHTAKGSIVKVEKTEWIAPQGEEREAVVSMLKDRGLYDSVAAFNAAKFNTWYRAELEADPTFRLKGVELRQTQYLKRGK